MKRALSRQNIVILKFHVSVKIRNEASNPEETIGNRKLKQRRSSRGEGGKKDIVSREFLWTSQTCETTDSLVSN
uniref:Uncharacterized protein n=1 Tax=Rhizophora mucronata TaxID=61149 RepID=A0A2P2M613_RHIMU